MSLFLTGIASEKSSALFREMDLQGHAAVRMEDIEVIPTKITSMSKKDIPGDD
jgi:hypothetical protein